MNIIFLDIDGVMNSEDSICKLYNTHPKDYWNIERNIPDEIFPDEYLLNLKELVDQTDAKIVISSSWRTHFPAGRLWVTLKRNLAKYGLHRKIIGITPRTDGFRGDEIRMWLSEHPEVKRFVIIDDDNDMCEFTNTHLVQTNYKTGFVESAKIKALRILNCE